MKKVELSQNEVTINISNVKNTKLYAYITSAGRASILSRLGSSYARDHKYGIFHYGFVNITITPNYPTYTADTLEKSITKALTYGAQVMEFENLTEFMEWRLKL